MQTDIIAVQRVYYNQLYSFSCPHASLSFELPLTDAANFSICLFPDQWFLVMSSQLIGFSAGGITSRFLVIPSNMIWPTTLVTCALFNTLHSQQYGGSGVLGGMSRERFFLYASTGSFLWCESVSLCIVGLEMVLKWRYADFFPGYLCMSFPWRSRCSYED